MRDRWDSLAVTVRCQGQDAGGPRCEREVRLTEERRQAWERGERIYCAAHVELAQPERAA